MEREKGRGREREERGLEKRKRQMRKKNMRKRKRQTGGAARVELEIKEIGGYRRRDEREGERGT